MEKKTYSNLVVSSAPHIVSNVDTTRIMAMVIMALVPSFLVSVYVFGMRVISLTLVCIVSAVFFEWIWNVLMHRRQTIGDLSAALTGLLIAFNVPSGLPYWMAILGCFVAIIVVKQLFGGIGKNIANPAITARIVLFISFATEMTTWPLPRMAADTTSTATPLGVLAEGSGELPSNMEMFLGFIGGSMGEVSAIALLLGGLFLIWKKIISPIIPACFIGTVFVFAAIYYGATGGDAFNMAIFHVLAGGVMLGAFFMATDYVTTPLLPMGKVVFGIGCGLITMVIRIWGQYPEGVSFSILIMNCLTPLINNFFQKRMYGGAKKNEK
ncbi:MAG: RnfABCDGE type electron transport complex subunit D [Anaerovoracaceae bacterium]|nr:RnfABCDGE type electron transport complex subunit D [Bacillota bacterium]MEE0516762.1 RnfABCDGE type electron transport complex subunit D [Anaerovoracaceae bacterium]